MMSSTREQFMMLHVCFCCVTAGLLYDCTVYLFIVGVCFLTFMTMMGLYVSSYSYKAEQD